MSQTINRLSQLEINNAEAGMHADGGGLYLQVTKTATGQLNKSWLFRYSVSGRERQMGLGSLTQVKLADARQVAAECRQQRLDGNDPIEARERGRRMAEASGITFRRAFETFFATKPKSLSNAKHAAQWQSTMETYVFPTIGNRPVGEIEAREILDLLTPIWFAKAETARRVLQRLEAVFKSAILRGYRQRGLALCRRQRGAWHAPPKGGHHRALHYQRVPTFLADIRVTATRSGETRLARWREIDKQARSWTIPAERMKAKRSHIVPLSRRCLEIEARACNVSVLRPYLPRNETRIGALRYDIHKGSAGHRLF